MLKARILTCLRYATARPLPDHGNFYSMGPETYAARLLHRLASHVLGPSEILPFLGLRAFVDLSIDGTKCGRDGYPD